MNKLIKEALEDKKVERLKKLVVGRTVEVEVVYDNIGSVYATLMDLEVVGGITHSYFLLSGEGATAVANYINGESGHVIKRGIYLRDHFLTLIEDKVFPWLSPLLTAYGFPRETYLEVFTEE